MFAPTVVTPPTPNVPIPLTLLLSSIITALFCIIFPEVVSNLATASFVAEPGPCTSPASMLVPLMRYVIPDSMLMPVSSIVATAASSM